MSIMEVRLFELRIKGDRLDEINAEAIFERRAAARVRTQARRLFVRRLSKQLVAWVTQRQPATVMPSSTTAN